MSCGGAAGACAHTVLKAIERLAKSLGLLGTSPSEYLARTRERRLRLRGLGADAIDARIAARAAARANKDYARGDEIRDELAAQGIVIKDSPLGTDWTVAQ